MALTREDEIRCAALRSCAGSRQAGRHFRRPSRRATAAAARRGGAARATAGAPRRWRARPRRTDRASGRGGARPSDRARPSRRRRAARRRPASIESSIAISAASMDAASPRRSSTARAISPRTRKIERKRARQRREPRRAVEAGAIGAASRSRQLLGLLPRALDRARAVAQARDAILDAALATPREQLGHRRDGEVGRNPRRAPALRHLPVLGREQERCTPQADERLLERLEVAELIASSDRRSLQRRLAAGPRSSCGVARHRRHRSRLRSQMRRRPVRVRCGSTCWMKREPEAMSSACPPVATTAHGDGSSASRRSRMPSTSPM